MSAWQAQSRRAHVAKVEGERQARDAKARAELTDCQAQGERLFAELAPRRAALRPGDQVALAAFNADAAHYQTLLGRMKTLQRDLEKVYFTVAVPADSSARNPKEQAALPYRDEELRETEAEPINVRNRLSETTDPLLVARKFTELDTLAAKLRASKVQSACGIWRLRSFYDGFSLLPDHVPESGWTDRIALMQAWIAQRPGSITPRVALANVWCEWAWHARGGGYADSVSTGGERLFAERLAAAGKVLDDARNLGEKCPVWWEVYQRVALGLGWGRARVETLFEDAVRFEPLYTGFYTSRNNYLLPRWYGKPGEGAAFAQAAADRLGGEEGDVVYARLAWRLHSMGMLPNGFVVQAAGASWPRVRNGMEAIVRRYPDSIAAASELCYLYGQQGERARMPALFAQIGPFVDTSVYGDSKRFLSDRKFAFQ